jgi:THO complex subunit 2
MLLQVRGELPFTKCRIALDSVEFSEKQVKEDAASILADTVAHMGQEVSISVIVFFVLSWVKK